MRTIQEISWSAFLREPTQVEPLLEKGDVILKRRDGNPLRLTRHVGNDVLQDAMATAARLIAATTEAPGAPLHDVDRRLPWTHHLPAESRQLFVKEFVRELQSCAELGDFAPLAQLLHEWTNTASLYADGTARILLRPKKWSGKRVPRP